MTTWRGLASSRARASARLLVLLFALVLVTAAIIAGSAGHASLLATRAAQTALEDDSGLTVRTRVGADPSAQDELARRLLTEGFAPAPVEITTSYLSSSGEPIAAAEASAAAESFVEWNVLPDVSRITPAQLATLADRADRAKALVAQADTQGRGITVSGDLAATAERAAQERAQSEAFRWVPLSVLLVVAGTGLVQVAALLAATREAESRLLFARGASLRQVLGVSLTEAVIVALAGCVAGTALAAGLIGALGGGAAQLTTVLVAGIGALALAAGSLMGVAARAAVQAARGEGAHADRVRAVAGAASLALVCALAALSTWQLVRSGTFVRLDDDGRAHADPVAALAPALLLAVTAVAALVALAPITRLLELAARLVRGAQLWLAGAQLARGLRLSAVPVVLTVLATGTAMFASLFAGTTTAMSRDLATLAQGADVRVAVTPAGAGEVLPQPDLSGIGSVTASAPVWRTNSAQVGNLLLPVLAAPTRALAQVARLPEGLTLPNLSDGASAGLGLAIPSDADTLRVDLSARAFLDTPEQAKQPAEAAPASSVSVAVQLRDADTGQSGVLNAPTLDVQPPGLSQGDGVGDLPPTQRTSSLSVELPLPVDRRLVVDEVRIAVDQPVEAAWSITVDLDLSAGGTSLLGAATAQWAGDSLPPSRLDTSTSPWRLTSTLPGTSVTIGPYETFDAGEFDGDAQGGGAEHPAPARPRVPVALTSATAEATQLDVGDTFELSAFQNRVTAEVSAVVEAIPSLTGEHGVLLDSGAFGAAIAGNAPLGEPAEVWAAVADSPAPQADEGISAVASQSLWVAAASALLLAITGLAAATGSQLAARRPEVAVLRALGMTPAAQARSRGWEVAGVLLLAAGSGLAGGWAVALLVVDPLGRAATGGDLPYAPALRGDWPPLVVLLAVGSAAVAVLVGSVAARVRAQARDENYREEVR